MTAPPRKDDAETADLPVPAMMAAAAARAPRLDSVDLLRGLIMVFMALDHTRDFFSHLHFPPEDMTQTWPALFLARWLTHFSAPGFFFLAGTGAYLSLGRGRSPAKVSHFLWTRGLWLVLLEMTLIWFAWTFAPGFGFGGVIWALGWCMVANALILRLPMRWIVAVGALMVAGHN
ncbi:MAG: heparan-alpha-glucosaminide N-acetyltransferase domain-containing protein, partial [Acidobacteriota bacterium]|nr:heparan-alpha-glucosaminide N-acetyltransferase domain-containing protein [Acidobacteriota bacterium]